MSAAWHFPRPDVPYIAMAGTVGDYISADCLVLMTLPVHIPATCRALPNSIHRRTITHIHAVHCLRKHKSNRLLGRHRRGGHGLDAD